VVLEQKYAVHNAVRGEAWTEFLFYANGFTVDETRLAIRTFNEFHGRDVGENEIRSSPGYRELRSVLERREMVRPRGF
jgi:hypothetical protein